VCVALLLAAPASPAVAALPQPQGSINDFADVLSPEVEGQLDAIVKGVAADTSAEIAVVTVRSLEGQTVEQYALELFNAWGIGKKAQDNGVLVLVAPADRAMRIEVGYELEGVLPDGLAGEIIRTAFIPRFREDDYAGGILDGVTRVAQVVRREPGAAVIVPADDSGDTPPVWVLVPFLGAFVAAGAFAAGVALRSKTVMLLVWGVMFGGIPMAMCAIAFPETTALTLAPLALVMAGVGFSKAGRQDWLIALRGKRHAASTGWMAGLSAGPGSSGSSSSGSSRSSSSSSFGGGSSGGGGASGRW
jgi:uncharacterized protein